MAFSLKLKDKTFSKKKKKNFHPQILNPTIPFFQLKRNKQKTNKYKNKKYASHMISASSNNQQEIPRDIFNSPIYGSLLSHQKYNNKAIKRIFLSWKSTLSSAMAEGREKRGRIQEREEEEKGNREREGMKEKVE